MHRRKVRFPLQGGPQPPGGSGGPGGAPGPPLPRTPILSVRDLARGVRRILESAYPEVAVRGEVVGVSRPRSGHLYFSLRDDGSEEAQLAVVLWRDDALRLRFRLEDGLRVVVSGRLTLYEPRGSCQVVARRVDPDGPGTLAQAFERLKARLAAEGLFAAERKRPLPFLPGRIGVITSPSGAALQDILRSIVRRNPRAWVRVIPVKVQGEGAAEEIAAALGVASRKEAGLDVVIVGRGGGSPEDLWAFNEERVVRAVAASAIPTVSAVGHEVDFTLCDFAADIRAQTPTHAGALVVPDVLELEERLADRAHRLRGSLVRRLALIEERLRRLASQRVMRDPRESIALRRQRLDDLDECLRKGLYNSYLRWQDALNVLGGKLEALSPLAVLRRGYSVVFNPRGEVVRSLSQLARGDLLRVLLGEGEAHARVCDFPPRSPRGDGGDFPPRSPRGDGGDFPPRSPRGDGGAGGGEPRGESRGGDCQDRGQGEDRGQGAERRAGAFPPRSPRGDGGAFPPRSPRGDGGRRPLAGEGEGTGPAR